MAQQGQLTQKVNGVPKVYFFHDLGIITRNTHLINNELDFYYYPQNNLQVAVWLDDGSGAISNPWDDAEFWNE